MAAPLIHAPDGGVLGHALCQNPTGDVTTTERDVTCPDCDDELEQGNTTFARLTAALRRDLLA